MKKWWVFVTVLAVAAGGIGLILGARTAPQKVEVKQLQWQTVEQTVACTGVVEAGGNQGVYAGMTCVIDEVLVKEGQAVLAGETLATVDKSRTRMLQSPEDRPTAALSLAAMADVITAPVDGIVVSVSAASGQTLGENVPCIVIAPRDQLQVRVAIRERYLPVLQVGQAVHLQGDGFRRQMYTGRLTSISSSARSSTGGGGTVVEGVVTLDAGQADDSLRLGLSARANVVVSSTQEGLVVPFETVVEEAKGTFVYLAQNGRAVRYPVQVEADLPAGRLIKGDELLGQWVICQPDGVQDGMAIAAAYGEEGAS